MSHWHKISAYVVACSLALVSTCMAQSESAGQQKAAQGLNCDSPPDFSTFVNCRIDQLTIKQLPAAEVTAAQKRSCQECTGALQFGNRIFACRQKFGFRIWPAWRWTRRD